MAAVDSNAVSLATIALVGTILAIVVKPLFTLLKENTRAQKKTATAIESLVTETKKGNHEAKQRNGHLAELTIQSKEQIIDSVTKINVQHVSQQTVHTSTVQDETVEREVVKDKK